MARREEFTAGQLYVDEALVLPVYEEANRSSLKTLLNERLLRSGSGKSIATNGLAALGAATSAARLAEVANRYKRISVFELPNKGVTVLGFLHGNRKTTSAAITTQAHANDRLITSIFDSEYKESTYKVGSADTFTGANNSDDIGLYLVSYFVDEYNPSETLPPGRWDVSKYTMRI